MKEKKAKIIEFDEETINAVNSYGKMKGINTFSGVVRKIVTDELDKYGISGKNKEYSDFDEEIISNLSNTEVEYYKELKLIFRNWDLFQAERSKIYDDLKQKEENSDNGKGLTTYERIAFYYTDEDSIKYLYETVKILFIETKHEIKRVDETVDKLIDVLIRMGIDINLAELTTELNKEVLKGYIQQTQLYRNNHEWENEYNNVVEKYFEYKEGNISAYSMIRKLCEYI